MDISKTCQTCDFNFEGYCTCHSGIGYGVKITDSLTERECWKLDSRILYQWNKSHARATKKELLLTTK